MTRAKPVFRSRSRIVFHDPRGAPVPEIGYPHGDAVAVARAGSIIFPDANLVVVHRCDDRVAGSAGLEGALDPEGVYAGKAAFFTLEIAGRDKAVEGRLDDREVLFGGLSLAPVLCGFLSARRPL